MTDAYRTLAGRGEADFEVQGSEFVGYATPAPTVEDAEAFVESVEREHADATHNVPAYRVRVESGVPDERSESGARGTGRSRGGPGDGYMLREYQSDDGEPTGSAGKPALNVLQQQDVENAVVVVTRYYGGTNLGVGGLARAYSRASKEAIEAAGVVEQRPQERFTVTVEYDDSGTVRGILESADCDFDADYGETVAFDVTVASEDAGDLRERIQSATSGRAAVK
ncbi:IMPACT family protein [Halobacterium noricense]|uniref:IMPACT family protein n=1 Tax=Halobacterium noricense TaxID=223182 RepID=UPI001E46D83A|nr:YigZ family protein [Halobacterium noricense]UHH25143.1 IMPACT family protein [Halobacterium noricense]